MLNRRQFVICLVAAAGLAFSAGWTLGEGNPQSLPAQPNFVISAAEINPDPELAPFRIRDIDDVWSRLKNSYYDASKLERSKLEYNAVKGFVAGIEDPYTAFMTPDESKDFENGLEGHLEGIGAELEVKNGKLVVVSPLKDSPAEKAGIKPADIIYKIDNSLTEEMTLFDAVRKIRGKKGTSVTLTIIRENIPNPLEIKVLRDKVTIDSITVKKLDNEIYHVAIHQFSDHTKTEFQNVVQKILLEKARGMVLDLRGNGGGYLDISVDILSELLAGEKNAAVIKKRDPTKNETVKTNGSGRLADIPLAVLVNKGSASASEIIAGAIQDYKRGILIGEKTFGKGSVQQVDKLPDGASLRYTIAKWFTPLERSIDDVGIAPDVEIKMTDEDEKAKRDPQLEEAIKYLVSLRGA